ncbi:hypothetical protein H4R34_000650 [Dimargaris verticillata]|uniref:Uncharacterized protein n=1 Tax=Dimargaris verticillata TaxID=2761393 RepID=A0A9W8EB28_9FUNG|nr:hypothetical protein H4R34_000650 [Dimargaris verticillata]
MLKRTADSYRRYVDAKPRARVTVESSPTTLGDPDLNAETEHQAQTLYHKIMANLDALESDLEASSASESDEVPPVAPQKPECDEAPTTSTDPDQLVYVCSLCPGKQMHTLTMAEDHFRSKLHQRRLAQFEKQLAPKATAQCTEPSTTDLPATATDAVTGSTQSSSPSLIPQVSSARLSDQQKCTKKSKKPAKALDNAAPATTKKEKKKKKKHQAESTLDDDKLTKKKKRAQA